MDQTLPSAKINPQVQATPPIVQDGTLVNDTVALVDDTKAFVGSQTTQIQGLGVEVGDNSPTAYIKVRR